MDLKSENDFIQYYENEYNYTIDRYYDNYKSKRKEIIVSRIIILIVLVIISILVMDVLNLKSQIEQSSLPYNSVIICYYTFISLVFAFSTFSALKKSMTTITEYIIGDIYSFIGDTNPAKPADYRPNSKLNADSINAMDLFNLDILKYTGKNYSLVQYNKKNMCFCDLNFYLLEKTSKKKYFYKDGKKMFRYVTRRKNIFDGLYIGAPLNKNNTNHIYLIPNNLKDTVLQSKIMEYIRFKGVPVMLENLEFSKKYKVFCDDEVQARYILSLSLMEKINKLDELFEGKKYIVFKEGRRFAICIDGLKLQYIREMKLPVFRNKNKEKEILKEMYIKISNLFKIYHILDLGNTLYTKNV